MVSRARPLARRTVGAAAVVSVLLALAACGSTDQPVFDPTSAPTEQPVTTAPGPTGTSGDLTPDQVITTIPGATVPDSIPEGDPRTSVIMDGMVLGGSFSGVTYSNIFDGAKPYRLQIVRGRPLHVTQFVSTRPAWRPDGYPASGDTVVAYQWTAECGGGRYPLSPVLQRAAPLRADAYVGTPLAPSFAIDLTVDLPDACYGPGSGPGGSAGYLAVTYAYRASRAPQTTISPWLMGVEPSAVPQFDAERDGQGRPVLYLVGTSDQIEQVQRDGDLASAPAGFLRYFLTSCRQAQQLLATLTEAGRDSVGIIRVPAPSDFVEKAVGGTVKLTGGSEAAVWGSSELTGVTWDQASVIVQGTSSSDCSP